jgi:hypothetical protein
MLHYIACLDYYTIFDLFFENINSLWDLSKDNLSCYEISAGKWNIKTLKKIIELMDKYDNENINKPITDFNNFYNINILKNAFILALEMENEIENKELELLELLYKQIKIQFTVDTSKILLIFIIYLFTLASGSLINDFNKNSDTSMMNSCNDENVKYIQKYVKGWLRRNHFKDMKKATNTLKESKFIIIILIKI